MSVSKFYITILFLAGFLSVNASAETISIGSATRLKLNFNALNSNLSQHYYTEKRLLKNEPRIARVKLGMVFSPEDLVTISSPENNIDEQITPPENRETIIAVYIQSFF